MQLGVIEEWMWRRIIEKMYDYVDAVELEDRRVRLVGVHEVPVPPQIVRREEVRQRFHAQLLPPAHALDHLFYAAPLPSLPETSGAGSGSGAGAGWAGQEAGSGGERRVGGHAAPPIAYALISIRIS